MNRFLLTGGRGLLLCFYMSGQLTFASGSYGVGGGDQANQAYNLGKAAFYKKLLCPSCPLAGVDPDESKAAELVRQLSGNPEFAQRLSEREREAVVQYLQRRYDIN